MRLLVSWLRDFVDVTASPDEIADDARRCAASKSRQSSAIGARRRGHRFRDHGQPPRLPERARPRARGRDGLRSAAGAAGSVHRAGSRRRSRCASRRSAIRIASRVTHRRRRSSARATRRRSPTSTIGAIAGVDGRRVCRRAGVRPISPICRHHQLRAARARPSDARVRSRAARRRRDPHPARAARRDASRRSTASSGRSTPTCSSSPTRPRAGRRRRHGRRGRPRCRRPRTVVVFESAYFKPASVRRTSKRLGLKTEARRGSSAAPTSTHRWSRSQRALALMEQIGAGTLDRPDRRSLSGARAARCTLHLRRDRLAHVCSASRCADADVERILRGLGLT